MKKKRSQKREMFLKAIERLRPAAQGKREIDFDDYFLARLHLQIKEAIGEAQDDEIRERAAAVASAWYWLTEGYVPHVRQEGEEPPVPTYRECASDCNGGHQYLEFFIAGYELGSKKK